VKYKDLEKIVVKADLNLAEHGKGLKEAARP
jgi:hypothetical protein